MAVVQPSCRILRLVTFRGISVLGEKLNSRQYSESAQAKLKSKSQTFLQKLWDSEGSTPTDAHSKTLTSNLATYEFQFDDVKPEYMDQYVEETGALNTRLSEDESYPGQLIGSWTSIYGDQDKAVHLWVYKDGYKGVTQQMKYNKENEEMREFNRKKCNWINARSNQLCQEFSYWGEPRFRRKPHIYELRTYHLKPGTLIEWGNKWGSAINIRRKDAVGGFFSQVGDLYLVHHLWAYYDMQHRKEERENMWQVPGWDDCVAATVPLVRHMKARILLPTSNSPMQ